MKRRRKTFEVKFGSKRHAVYAWAASCPCGLFDRHGRQWLIGLWRISRTRVRVVGVPVGLD